VHVLREHSDGVLSAAYSPDGKWIVTASIDQTARVWDAATGEVVRVLRGHSAEVNAAAFSPDGQRIATASRDGTARIWDAATGRELIVLRGARSDLLDLAYSPDGRSLATVSADGIVRLYRLQVEDLVALARARVTRALTCEERVQFLRETLVCPTPTPKP
jgi:WD40 repeat protein